ncbi:MAG: sensor histidine kinase [Bacteroidales bacterium]|nr:sensor histidine kinase [Bacteroidales bacterium]
MALILSESLQLDNDTPIKIALILSVILQFSAAIIAMTLIKRTRNNIAWWLISLGFMLMAIRRVFEVLQVYDSDLGFLTGLLSSWTGVLISATMLISLVFIRRIFNIQKQIDAMRKHNESRVLSAILRTEENERQNFSKELHDGLGPLLSSVKMAISTSRYSKKSNHDVLENAEKLIDESIITLKNISNNLSPHILVNFGLLKALKSFIAKLQNIEEPKISLNSNIGNQRFAFNIEVVLYRVICELINNTLKHARAKNINISLLVGEKYLSLEYVDDGIGFDEDKIRENLSGLGYSNIQSRIKSLNGTYDIFSKPGEGVRVSAQINLK